MQAIGLDEDLVEVDLYAFIGAKASDEKKDIKKAYKRKALEKHPDKNKDNPNAPAEFDKLKRAYAFLSDDTKREQYDKVVRARESRKRKLEEQNAGRMSMRQALERREAAARQEKANQQKASDAEKAKFQTDMMIKELMRTGKIGAPSSHTPPTPEAAVHERKKAKTSRVETPTINGSPKPPAPVHTSNTLMISWAKKKQEGTDEESLRKVCKNSQTCGKKSNQHINSFDIKYIPFSAFLSSAHTHTQCRNSCWGSLAGWMSCLQRRRRLWQSSLQGRKRWRRLHGCDRRMGSGL